MKLIGKAVAWGLPAVLLVAVLGIGFGVGWGVFFGPKARPVTNRTFARTADNVERGRYLVRHVTGCLVCHSPLDANDKTRLQAGMEGAGDVVIPQGPGRVIAPNITPDPDHGIGRWTDDEIARAVREGVSRDGHALFPMMPYRNYLAMTDADLGAIIAYLRSLPPVKQAPGRTELIVPVRYIVRTVPEPLTGAVETHFENEVQRGEYLTRVASCQDCHSTFDDRRRPLPGLDFAGGNLMQEREGTATTANITPDETGIKGYTADTFREMMRTRKRAGRELSPLMPAAHYGGMNDQDLNAIFAYLRTVKPVRHIVEGNAKPTLCRVCNREHGGGEKN